jgi:hypothetical protein
MLPNLKKRLGYLVSWVRMASTLVVASEQKWIQAGGRENHSFYSDLD